MEDETIIAKINQAMDTFFHEDLWLVQKDLSERSIAHRIAFHLTPLFEGLQVDCEYNGDIDSPSGKKKIQVLKDELAALKLLRENDSYGEDGIVSRSVYPDIIIHSRGDNDNNLCVIEIKKTSSNVKFSFDQLKLQAYTSDADGNLGYQLGVFLEIGVGNSATNFKIGQYKNGAQIEQS